MIDQHTRECLCSYADRSQTSEKVVAQMKHLVVARGVPESITTDNVLNASVFLIAGHSKSEGRAMRGLFVNEQFSSAEMPVVST